MKATTLQITVDLSNMKSREELAALLQKYVDGLCPSGDVRKRFSDANGLPIGGAVIVEEGTLEDLSWPGVFTIRA